MIDVVSSVVYLVSVGLFKILTEVDMLSLTNSLGYYQNMHMDQQRKPTLFVHPKICQLYSLF